MTTHIVPNTYVFVLRSVTLERGELIGMMIRRSAVAVIAAATVAMTGCGIYADSTGQTCLIVLGIPVCDTAA